MGSSEREVHESSILKLRVILDELDRVEGRSAVASSLFWIEIASWVILLSMRSVAWALKIILPYSKKQDHYYGSMAQM